MTKFMDKVALRTYLAMQNFLQDERGDVNVVSIVVLIGIAIALALLFKDQAAQLIEDIFTNQIAPATNGITATPNP